MANALDTITFVVLARRPEPGRVKTRLVRAGLLDDAGAAALARSMLECSVERLSRHGPLVLATTDPGAGLGPGPGAAGDGDPLLATLAALTPNDAFTVVDQGGGDLGERLDRVWRRVGADRRVAFFGADTPDVPDRHLEAIAAALAEADVALGPTDDGGYWTLAARAYHPEVLREIDWGGPSVYDQTVRRANDQGLAARALPSWRDVDRPDDVRALRERIAALPVDGDRALRRLGERLDALLPETPPPDLDPGPGARGPQSES